MDEVKELKEFLTELITELNAEQIDDVMLLSAVEYTNLRLIELGMDVQLGDY